MLRMKQSLRIVLPMNHLNPKVKVAFLAASFFLSYFIVMLLSYCIIYVLMGAQLCHQMLLLEGQFQLVEEMRLWGSIVYCHTCVERIKIFALLQIFLLLLKGEMMNTLKQRKPVLRHLAIGVVINLYYHAAVLLMDQISKLVCPVSCARFIYCLLYLVHEFT